MAGKKKKTNPNPKTPPKPNVTMNPEHRRKSISVLKMYCG